MPVGREGCVGDLGGCDVDPTADRGAVVEGSLGPEDHVSELGCAGGTVDDVPADHQNLLARAGPIDEADRDLLVRAGPDGTEHLRIRDGGRIAFTLQLALRLLHAARTIHSQTYQKVD